MTIWKYKLPCTSRSEVSMPKGAQVLTAQTPFDELCVWALVDPDAPLTTRRFAMVATSENADDVLNARYINTVQFRGGLLVFHIFELP